jgi:hypothetical protein
VHLLRSCEALNQAWRDIFDGHDILQDGFVWSVSQIIRFLQPLPKAPIPKSAYTQKRVYPKALHKSSLRVIDPNYDHVLGLITQILPWFRV